jgi:hypothetical protein
VRESAFYPETPPNNGMHPTAKSVAFMREIWMLDTLNARRVMPGVRLCPLASMVVWVCRSRLA